MKHKKLIFAGICIIMLSAMTSAWFGELAARYEAIELEFRATFILVIYYLLYGTVLGTPVGYGLLAIYEDLPTLILMNPPVVTHDMMRLIIKYFISILGPMYITAILITGTYLMLLSGSPKGRRRAKILFPRLIASMVFVSLSLPILQIMFNVSYELSEGILDSSPIRIEAIFIETINDLVRIFTASTLTTFEGGHLFLLLIFLLIIGMFSVLAMRYFVLLIFTLIFPLGIFFYTFGLTRAIGRFILEQTILWTFLQVIIALIIVVVNVGVATFGIGGDLRTVIGVTTFLVVIVSPLMVVTMVRRFLP